MKRLLICLALFVGAAGCGNTNSETPPTSEDATPTDSVADSVPGSPGTSNFAITFTFTGPAALTANMGDANVPLFCFSLQAAGGPYKVRLPLMHISAADGGVVLTNSLIGVVFESPSLVSDSMIVAGPAKVTPAPDATSAAITPFRSTEILLSPGEALPLCVDANIVAWSLTPQDFFGKSYRVTMDDWSDGDVTDALGHVIPRAKISAPLNAQGNTVTISSQSGAPPVKFTGTMHVDSDPATPQSSTALPGQNNVPLGSFFLRADGNGACIRGIDAHLFGTCADTTFTSLTLEDETNMPPKILYTNSVSGSAATFGWHAYGILFCLNGGASGRYLITGNVSPGAPGGSQCRLTITPPADVDTVTENVAGSPISFNPVTIGHP